jgi:hypothetical protein
MMTTAMETTRRTTTRIAAGGHGVASAIIAVLWLLALTTPTPAQKASRPELQVPSAILAEPATETPVTIRITEPASVPRLSFVRLRGLPPAATVSDGHTIATGTWVVALTSLNSLRIAAPKDLVGRYEITVTLVTIDGEMIDEARTTLVVAPLATLPQTSDSREPATTILRASPIPAAPASEPPITTSRAAPTPGPGLSGEARDRTTKMLQKANELMSTGDISAARLFYQRAADAGLAEAALAMALTWDPNELGRWKVLGLKADAKEAQRWYERAKALGSGEADQKLKRLGSN